MANRYTIGSGDWTNPAIWDGGSTKPGNNDQCNIKSGHTVNFNEDMSGWANGITLVVETGGVLQGSTTSGTYYLKIGGPSTVSYIHGSFLIGTSEAVPYPDTCKLTIISTGSCSLAGNGTIAFYCSEPTTKTAKLTADAAIGTNRLYLDTDVSGETNHWKNGVYIGVQSNAVKAYTGGETRYITAVVGGATPYIDLDSNLTVAMPTGSWVYLRDRNIRVTGSTTTAGFFRQASTAYTSLIVGAEFSGFTAGYVFGGNADSTLHYDILGGVVANCSEYFTNGFYYPATITISKTIFGLVTTGNDYILGSVNGATISDCTVIGGAVKGFQVYGIANYNNCKFYGTAAIGHSGIGNIFNNCEFDTVEYASTRGSTVVYNNCTFNNCTSTNSECYGILKNCTVNANCTYAASSVYGSEYYNCNLLPAIEFIEFPTMGNVNLPHNYVPSFDHDQSAGAYKSWTKGGITTFPLTATPPTGYTSYYSIALSSATFVGFYQTLITVESGETITYNVYIRKSASMAYLPKVSLINMYEDPLEYSTYTALVSEEMTDSVDTWEMIPITYTNTTDLRQNLLLRVEGKNATGTVLTLPIKVQLKESWGG
mgnify:CR=1 FL=1